MPALPLPLATTSYHDRNHQRVRSGARHGMPEREAGRHQGHATAARKRLFSYPFLSSPLPSILLVVSLSLSLSLTLWTFYPSREISSTTWRLCRPAGRQAGEAQTTCMQLGLAWRGEQKALKDRTGQSQTDGRACSPPPLSYRSLEAGHAAGRVQSRRECGRGTAVVARPLLR